MTIPNLRPFRIFQQTLFCLLSLSVLLSNTSSNADELSWNAGDGFWNNANNWTPNGVPGDGDAIRIGNLPGVQNNTVFLQAPGAGYDLLEISNGMTLDMNGGQLASFNVASISGLNSRLIARPAPGPNFHAFNGTLNLHQGSYFELVDGVDVRFHHESFSNGVILGQGTIRASFFSNNGIISPVSNGGITILAGNPDPNLPINLDGDSGNGSLNLATHFSQLNVIAGSLTDSFSGNIVLARGALLDMNIADGWTADGSSIINVIGSNNPAAASQIDGSEFSFGGQMNLSVAQSHLRVLAPMTIQNSASINIATAGWLELDGITAVQGGQFTLGQGAKLEFDGATTMQGGVFSTTSSNIGDGFVAFNGPTTWNGNVTLNGASRQNGNATVGGGLGAVINANRFDMDGGTGNTNWNINGNLVVNADQIGTSGTNRFDGTINVAGGFLPKLTMNLTDPSASWVMGGTMNLNGLTHLVETRIAGSDMIVQGDLNVTGGRVRINADTTFANVGGGGGANVHIGPADSVLILNETTIVESKVSFTGLGTLQNAATGEMTLNDEVSLELVALFNLGSLDIGGKGGTVSVNGFENVGTWQVDIGGHLAGDEHDLMIVGGGQAFLGGLLEVDLIDAGGGFFVPEIGDQFTILESLSGVNGTFLDDPISMLDGKFYHWSVVYNSHDVRLQLSSISIPEPGSLLVLASASVLLTFRRRRRSGTVQVKWLDAPEMSQTTLAIVTPPE